MNPSKSWACWMASLFAFAAPWLVVISPGGSQELIADNPEAGLTEWRKIESVLTHPRCLNCHGMTDYPRQGDDGRAHGLAARRGPDGHGIAPKCQACHRDENQTASGIPGAKDWHMAPLSMGWTGLTPGALCTALLDPARNGGRTGEKVIDHGL